MPFLNDSQLRCACGCKSIIPIAKHPSHQATYVHGHNPRGNKFHRMISEQQIIKCACGCGEELFKFDKYGNERQFINHHQGSIEQRFWKKVRKTDGCWEWMGAKNDKGYGQIFRNPILLFAHRFSYELNIGPIPEKLLVLHKCDNRICVRPDHLFLGTAKDNTHDMISKGRHNFFGLNRVSAFHLTKLLSSPYPISLNLVFGGITSVAGTTPNS